MPSPGLPLSQYLEVSSPQQPSEPCCLRVIMDVLIRRHDQKNHWALETELYLQSLFLPGRREQGKKFQPFDCLVGRLHLEDIQGPTKSHLLSINLGMVERVSLSLRKFKDLGKLYSKNQGQRSNTFFIIPNL